MTTLNVSNKCERKNNFFFRAWVFVQCFGKFRDMHVISFFINCLLKKNGTMAHFITKINFLHPINANFRVNLTCDNLNYNFGHRFLWIANVDYIRLLYYEHSQKIIFHGRYIDFLSALLYPYPSVHSPNSPNFLRKTFARLPLKNGR